MLPIIVFLIVIVVGFLLDRNTQYTDNYENIYTSNIAKTRNGLLDAAANKRIHDASNPEFSGVRDFTSRNQSSVVYTGKGLPYTKENLQVLEQKGMNQGILWRKKDATRNTKRIEKIDNIFVKENNLVNETRNRIASSFNKKVIRRAPDKFVPYVIAGTIQNDIRPSAKDVNELRARQFGVPNKASYKNVKIGQQLPSNLMRGVSANDYNHSVNRPKIIENKRGAVKSNHGNFYGKTTLLPENILFKDVNRIDTLYGHTPTKYSSELVGAYEMEKKYDQSISKGLFSGGYNQINKQQAHSKQNIHGKLMLPKTNYDEIIENGDTTRKGYVTGPETIFDKEYMLANPLQSSFLKNKRTADKSGLPVDVVHGKYGISPNKLVAPGKAIAKQYELRSLPTTTTEIPKTLKDIIIESRTGRTNISATETSINKYYSKDTGINNDAKVNSTVLLDAKYGTGVSKNADLGNVTRSKNDTQYTRSVPKTIEALLSTDFNDSRNTTSTAFTDSRFEKDVTNFQNASMVPPRMLGKHSNTGQL
jgi:hypothetical protein